MLAALETENVRNGKAKTADNAVLRHFIQTVLLSCILSAVYILTIVLTIAVKFLSGFQPSIRSRYCVH